MLFHVHSYHLEQLNEQNPSRTLYSDFLYFKHPFDHIVILIDRI